MMGLFARAFAKRGLTTQFKGAQIGRLTLDWVFAHLSADAEVQSSLYTLRGRARELVRNNAWANRYVGLVQTNVVGPNGIVLQAKLARKSLNQATEAAWKAWGRVVTEDDKWSWIDTQHLAEATELVDGECFLRLVRGADNDFGLALQFLDADLLDENFNQRRTEIENEIRLGVEIDARGKPLAYHFWSELQGDINQTRRERIRIPADQIIHYYTPYRPNQTRGIPRFSPVMYDLNMLRGYQEAELVAARMGAAKTGFFEAKADSVAWGESQDEIRIDAEPGTPEQLPPGWTFNEWSPEHPTTAYPDFTAAALRSIASGLDVSYTSLTSDLTRANFASSRVGLLAERDFWATRQRHSIEHLSEPVFREWVKMARLAGMLDTRVSVSMYVESKQWQPRGWTWVDPLKDVQAAVMAKKNRLTSTQKILAGLGEDLVDVYDDHAAEKELSDETGVPLVGGGDDPAADPAEPVDAQTLALVAER
jgi:lambda family phage portal protein